MFPLLCFFSNTIFTLKQKKTTYSTTGELQLQSFSLPALTRLRKAKHNPALQLGRPKHSSRAEPKLLNTPLQLWNSELTALPNHSAQHRTAQPRQATEILTVCTEGKVNRTPHSSQVFGTPNCSTGEQQNWQTVAFSFQLWHFYHIKAPIASLMVGEAT